MGWQWKQTNNYHAQISPLYRNCESIEQDLNKVFDKGGRYIDLMDECKRISTATKELKARFSEIAAPTDTSRETQVAFSSMMASQIDRSDSYLKFLQADLTVKSKDRFISSMSANSYLRNYSSDQIEEARGERATAVNNRSTALTATNEATKQYKAEKKKILIALSIKDFKGLDPDKLAE